MQIVIKGNNENNNRNILINKYLTINGENKTIITIDSQGNRRICTIKYVINVTNQNLKLENRKIDDSTIYNTGNFNVFESTFQNNTNDFYINSIFNTNDRIQFSQIVGNTTSMGEIYNNGSLNAQINLYNSNNSQNENKITSTSHNVKPGTYTANIKIKDMNGASETLTAQIKILSIPEASLMIHRYIQKLPSSAFNGSAIKIRTSIKFIDINLKLIIKNYQGAINALKDLRERCDGSLVGNKTDVWIKDKSGQQNVCKMIDNLIAYIQTIK